MLAQKISVCGNLFSKKFFALRDFNREEKLLSSSRVVNATRVVQANLGQQQALQRSENRLRRAVALLW
jgi:hypothetical protein